MSLEDFGPVKLAPSVKAWIATGSPARGPLCWSAPDVLFAKPWSCRDLAKNAPDGPFPAVQLTEVRGVPLIVALETGRVISLHHDATLYEYAADAAKSTKDPRSFVKDLARRGGAFDLDELRRLAEAVAAWPRLDPEGMGEARRIRAIANGFGFGVAELAKRFAKSRVPFEFLGIDDEILGDLASAPKALAKIGGVRVDLSRCWLQAWPDELDGTPVERLDLSWNPDLPWADLAPRLAKLQSLRILKVAECGIDEEALAAALPGVKVRGERRGAGVLSADGRQLDLRGCQLKKLPKEVDAMLGLVSIDLSNNPKLDWEDTCDRLARLPALEEVRFVDNDLRTIPALERIPKLRNFEVGNSWGTGNVFRTKDCIALVGRLPMLRVASLGELHFDMSILKVRESGLASVMGDENSREMWLPPCDAEDLTVEFNHYGDGGDAFLDWIARMPLHTLRLTWKSQHPPHLGRLRGLPLRTLSFNGPGDHLPELLEALSDLESLELDWPSLVPGGPSVPVELPEVLRRLPRLRELKLNWGGRYPCQRPSTGLPAWLSELPLEVFELRVDGWLPGAVDGCAPLAASIGGLTSLRRLVLSLSGSTRSVSLSLDFTRFPSLESLCLKGFELVTPLVLPASIRSVELQTAPVNLGALVELREAHLGGQLGAESIAALATLPRLETLSAGTRNTALRFPALPTVRHLVSPIPVAEAPALVKLDTSARSLPERLPVLRELVWTGRTRADIETILAVAAGYASLRSLTIHNFFPEDDARLPEGFAALRQLDRLRVFHTAYKGAPNRARLREWLPDCEVDVG